MESSPAKPHSFDLTLPLGGLLGFYGVVLILYGLIGNAELTGKSLGTNVNLIWGIVMLVLGGLFLFAARKNRRKTPQ